MSARNNSLPLALYIKRLVTRLPYSVSIDFEAVRVILYCVIKRLHKTILNLNLSLVILILKEPSFALINQRLLISIELLDSSVVFNCCAEFLSDILTE